MEGLLVNPPSRVGDRYRCFVLVRADMTYGGAYGQTCRWPIWECEDCGYRLKATYSTWQGERRWGSYDLARMADHHECGHAPCERCGKALLRRKDGTPRQHPHHLCPGKTPGDKIELEFVKNMSERGYH